jgi:type II secretory pathway pseudopilin PulG
MGVRHTAASPAGGFTYVGTLIMVGILSITAAATLRLGALAQRRAAEQELLEIGDEFRNAFISYANATPAGMPRTPPSLQELLKDPRYPTPRRHLRKMYVDPISGQETWGTVPAVPGPGIVGVYSMAEGKPIKIGNFDLPYEGFEGKTSYRDWVFSPPPEAIITLTGPSLRGRPAPTQTPAAQALSAPR